MNLSIVAVALVSAFLAYVNGANDVSKGIATLVGSRVSDYRRAIVWGALWTTCGGLAAFELSRALVVTFGKGLLTVGVHPTLPAAIAALVGAGLWVALATAIGLPVFYYARDCRFNCRSCDDSLWLSRHELGSFD